MTSSSIIEKTNAAEKLKDQVNSTKPWCLLNEILEEDPQHVLTHLTLGRIYTLQGKFEQGRRAWPAGL